MDFSLAEDHSELDALLGELFAALDENDARQAFQKLDYFWARLAMHIRAEHLHLFPAILNRFGQAEIISAPNLETAQNALEKLREDHDFFMRELAAAIKQMRETLDGKSKNDGGLRAVEEKIRAVRNRLEKHNELEETEVYQWLAFMDESTRLDLNERMKKELENLPPRFDRFRRGAF